ncbi:MAG: ATP-binding cassette domain-containing protein [Pseudomonadota bacterium]
MAETKFCVVCGGRLEEGLGFCGRCGKPTDDLGDSQLANGTPLNELTEITIGRTPENQIQVDRPYISARHATLRRTDDGFEVIDHRTLSGTYLNGAPIWGSAKAGAGDTVGVGSFDFKITADLNLIQRDLEGKLFIEGHNLTYRIKKFAGGVVKLLDNASLVVHPGELVGILGPSGHGKTTLLNALIRNLKVNRQFQGEEGYVAALDGQTWINTEALGPNYHAFMRIIGFVPQDDLVHPELTVREALRYTHHLRLPSDHSEEEVEARIEQVLDALKLDPEIWDQPIGSTEKRGISGGERKRVNIAIELLTDPDILVLDEPTSGLASTDARNVVEILRDLAERGKTVIFTVHQPSAKILKLVDKLAVVAKCTAVDIHEDRKTGMKRHRPGVVTYFGPACGERAPDGSLPECAARYFWEDRMAEDGYLDEDPEWDDVLDDADAILEGLDKRPLQFWKDKYYYEYLCDPENEEELAGLQAAVREAGVEEGWSTSLIRRYVQDRSTRFGTRSSGPPPARLRRSPNLLRQWWTLTRRFALNKWKDARAMLVMIVQAPIIAGFMIWVYNNTRDDALNNMVHIPLFLLVTVAIWFGCFNAAREIVAERSIFHRERMLGQSIGAYISSKVGVLALFSLFQCVILLGLLYLFLGLYGNFPMMLLVMFLAAFGGIGLGFLVSAASSSPAEANGLVPMVLIPQLIFGGLMQPLGQMDAAAALAAQLTPTRWGYEALLVLEENQRNHGFCPKQRCEGTFRIPELDDCRDNLESIRDQREGGLKRQDLAASASERSEEEPKDDTQAPTKSQCMPTRFTRACQFRVDGGKDNNDEESFHKKYERGPILGWFYRSELARALKVGQERQTAQAGDAVPWIPLGMLLWWGMVYLLMTYGLLRRRDVGVEKSIRIASDEEQEGGTT